VTPVPRREPLTFFTARERVLGWLAVALFAALFPLFVTWLFVSPRYGLGASWKPKAMSAATLFLLGALGAFVVTAMMQRAAQARSRRVLARCGHMACVYCGYDLRGVKLPGACPECGGGLADGAAIRAHWRRQYPSSGGADEPMAASDGG
jgi:hypothetical protein